MKKLSFFILLNLSFWTTLKSQTTTNQADENESGWAFSGGLHFFTAQVIKPNYALVSGINIYSKPTFAPAFDVTRIFKLKKKWSYSVGLRLAYLPTNQGFDVAENITRDNLAFDDYSKGILPYAALKGLVGYKILKKNKFSVVQSLGTSLVLIPRGFANHAISSVSSGVEVPYYQSKGYYNPNGLPFFSLLTETALMYQPHERQKWFLNVSFELAPKDAIASNYTFFSVKGELKGTITRRYQQMGIHLGGFFAINKKKKIASIETVLP
jgi:hypothetical protein